ncbi:hypothetical protein C7534_12264 [Pseudomonas sp. OV226]|jgi:hypothetical protein|nr:hypothetical protein C7534_12264 [Pseudomonas sp. OV226]
MTQRTIFAMIKETPNPPTADDAPPCSALKSPASRKPSTMFFVSPDINDEDLLAHACESLASASVMTSNFAGYLEGPHRHTAMAIQQIVMLAELAVNRMLDNVELPKSPHC